MCITQLSAAQRLIKKNSRHYVESQSLPSKVGPLLTDVWDQYDPFNLLCPIDTLTNERSVVGCVATAMTQVMHHWRWPDTYDWDNILDKYTEGNYTTEQAYAIAKLSYDCGLAVNMNYSSASSGARSIYQPVALVNMFGYDKGAQLYFKDFYSLAEVTLMLKRELADGRPVLISGYNADGGHAYVIDGYDENDYFHICWGNPGGEDNNWTYLPNMVPNQPQWYEQNSPEEGLNMMQQYVLGVMPENDDNALGYERHSFAFRDIRAMMDSNTISTIFPRNNIKVVVRDMSNLGWNTHDDSVSIMLKKNDEIVCPLYTYNRSFLLEEIDDTTYTDTLTLSLPDDIIDGTYTIVPMFRDNCSKEEKSWYEARVCTGTPNYIIARVDDNEVTLSSDTSSTSYLTLEHIDIPDMLINGSVPDYELTLRNHGPEMAGRVYLLMESLDGGKDFYIQKQGVTIGADETYEMSKSKRAFYASNFGTFRLHILYESNLFSDDLTELDANTERIITILSAKSIQITQK